MPRIGRPGLGYTADMVLCSVKKRKKQKAKGVHNKTNNERKKHGERHRKRKKKGVDGMGLIGMVLV